MSASAKQRSRATCLRMWAEDAAHYYSELSDKLRDAADLCPATYAVEAAAARKRAQAEKEIAEMFAKLEGDRKD